MTTNNASRPESLEMVPTNIRADDSKVDYVNMEHANPTEQQFPSAANVNHAQMRSKLDDLSVWESVKRQKLITIVAMSAAFSASLDGYRKSPFETSWKIADLACCCE